MAKGNAVPEFPDSKGERVNGLEDLELELLSEGIYRQYGFDFRQYAHESFRRRTHNLMELEKVPTVTALLEKILHNQPVMERFLLNMSVSVTSMFRDPQMYLAFREKIVPILGTYPSIRVWHAGCATGEEVYSMAMLLQEESLLEKAKIYATDINEVAIKAAKTGIFPLNSMKEYTSNYMRSGGQNSFSQYYSAKYDNAIFSSRLRSRMVFSKHNLATDSSFNEFNVIFCRNVMIYFNKALQEHVHELLYKSLCRFGIIVLGASESLLNSPVAKSYNVLDEENGIYQRRT